MAEQMSTEDYFNLLAYYAGGEVDEEKLAREIEAKGGVDLMIRTFVQDMNKYRPAPLMFFTIRNLDSGEPMGIVVGKNWVDIRQGLVEWAIKYWDINVLAIKHDINQWRKLRDYDPVILEVYYIGDDDTEMREVELQRVHSYGDINK